MEFKFGDRVRHKELGVGTIKYAVDESYAVEFDEKLSHLHTCGQRCKDYHGWWCTGNELEYAHEKAFKVGDRVYSYGFGYGTVKKVSDCGSFYATEFDKHHEKLHSCGGYTKLNNGWWCSHKEIELVSKEVKPANKEEKPKAKPFKVTVKLQTRKIYSRTLPDYVSPDVERLIINEPYVIVELDSGEIGKAKCHNDDKFDEVTGYNIAYRRALISYAKNDRERKIQSINEDYDRMVKELQDEIYFLGLDEDAFYL